MNQDSIINRDDTVNHNKIMEQDNVINYDVPDVTKNRIDNLKNVKNIIWFVLVGMAITTILLMFNLSGPLKLFFVGVCIFTMIILFILYRQKNNEIMNHIDELFNTN